MDSRKTSRSEFHRTHSFRLPTPPPDPSEAAPSDPGALNKAAMDKENEFLEYLSSLPKVGSNLQRSGSVFAPAMAAEDAFDHLEKLYKLMEQLLNLREQNAKLQRKVRDLEHMKNLQSMHRQVANAVLSGEDVDVPDIDEESVLVENFLDNLLQSSRSKKSCKSKPSQFKILPQRDRSSSLGDDLKTAESDAQDSAPPKSVPFAKKRAKVSKWTKVKAAFKWEKASSTVSDAKSQDSGLGGMMPVNTEVARYLRVPSTSDGQHDSGASPADSVLSVSWQGAHGLSTSVSLSPASSTDELNHSIHSEHRSVSRTGSAGAAGISRFPSTYPISDDEEGEIRSRSLDYSTPCGNNNLSKEDILKLQSGSKVPKTRWGKVKDIIQTRKESLRKKQNRLSAKSDECKTEWSAGSDQEEVFESSKTDQEESQTPSVTVTNADSLQGNVRSPSPDSDIPAAVLARYQQAVLDDDKCQVNKQSPRVQRRLSKWNKVKKAFLTAKLEDETQSVPASPTQNYAFFSDTSHVYSKTDDYIEKIPHRKISSDSFKSKRIQEEIYKSYEQLQKKLSLEFQEKMQEWEKIKTTTVAVASTSQACNAGNASAEEQRDPDFVRKMEEWEKIKNSGDTSKKRNIQMTNEENLPADFKKKLQEWEKIKKQGGKKENVETGKRDWQLWKSSSGHQTKQDFPQLGQPDSRNISEDFRKKLEEWKQIKASQYSGNFHQQQDNKLPSPSLSRKGSSGKILRQSKKYKTQEGKELNWFDHQLQFIVKERQRLEKEKEKFLGKEERSEKLRRSINNGHHKKDVLVHTSTGFYKFEGITKKYTQRIYEWEKARGIGPEASTIALLNSGYKPISKSPVKETETENEIDSVPRIKLSRSKSMDSVANMNCETSIMTHQPSSLSLNDMEELEMQHFADSRSTSDQILNESDYAEPEAVIVEVEDFVEETAAPLESRIEESRHHTPVYQTESVKLCESEKCEAPQIRRSDSSKAMSSYNLIQETIVLLNKIKTIENTCRSQMENEITDKREALKSTGAIPKRKEEERATTNNQELLKSQYIQQMETSGKLINKILMMQNANVSILKSTSYEKSTDMLDLSSELLSIAEKLRICFKDRFHEFHSSFRHDTTAKHAQEINDSIENFMSKLMEMKRNLTYLCAASDMTAPGRRKKLSTKDRKTSYRRASVEQIFGQEKSKQNEENTTDEEYETDKPLSSKRREKLIKSKSEDGYETRKDRIVSDKNKSDIKTEQPQETLNFRKKGQRKLQRCKKISENKSPSDDEKTKKVFDTNVIIPTNIQYVDATSRINSDDINISPVSIFVQTTRKLFTPFVTHTMEQVDNTSLQEPPQDDTESNKKQSESDENMQQTSVEQVSDNNSYNESTQLQKSDFPAAANNKIKCLEIEDANSEEKLLNAPSHLPPLPNSPISQRRDRHLTKETSPAIRIMIARYNQKLSEQESPGYKSGGSSGSASPVAWRSPVLERRVKTQSEKYQEEVNKKNNQFSPQLERKQSVQKSASVGVFHCRSVNKQVTIPQIAERGGSFDSSDKNSPKIIRGILKSSSVDFSSKSKMSRESDKQIDKVIINKKDQSPALHVFIPETKIAEADYQICPNLQERARKLRKAKEEFLFQQPSSSSSLSAPPVLKEEPIKYPTRNRLSQVSVESESSCEEECSGVLIKSASAGMINIEEEAFQQFRPEVHSEGYVSLPRQTKKKDGKFGISSIASKFRKVKMRRSKDSSQMNAVSTLCRQSLVVDINTNEGNNNASGEVGASGSKTSKKNSTSSADGQSSSTKTSWIKVPKNIFKPKQ